MQYLKKEWRGKLIFCMQINIKLSYRLILLILVGMARHAQITQNNKFAKSLSCLKKSGGWSWIFVQMSIKVFYKLILSFLKGMARHAWSTQNNKHAVSLQYLKKELSYELNFLLSDKHESLLQADTITFDGVDQVCLKYLVKFAM